MILVTGAAGFIGCHVCEMLLRNGHSVLGIDNFDPFYPSCIKRRNVSETVETAQSVKRPFQLYETDIRHTEKMRDIFRNYKVEAVIHLAACVGVRSSVSNPALYASVNFGGTAKLLERMKEFGVKRLVFASSSSVYGDSHSIPFSENESALHPISPYAVTKKAGEELCYVYHHLHDINAVCLRFFTVFGPRQRPDLAIHAFVRLMSEGKTIPVFGDGHTQRDYTYIGDILDGIYRALMWTDTQTKRYDIFNLGKGNPVSLIEMIQTVADTLGVKPVIEYMAPQREEVLLTYADISHARKILSYKPQTSFGKGIEEFVGWYKKQKLIGE
jgi:UDP-glucuronate 4-epimerase